MFKRMAVVPRGCPHHAVYLDHLCYISATLGATQENAKCQLSLENSTGLLLAVEIWNSSVEKL